MFILLHVIDLQRMWNTSRMEYYGAVFTPKSLMCELVLPIVSDLLTYIAEAVVKALTKHKQIHLHQWKLLKLQKDCIVSEHVGQLVLLLDVHDFKQHYWPVELKTHNKSSWTFYIFHSQISSWESTPKSAWLCAALFGVMLQKICRAVTLKINRMFILKNRCKIHTNGAD